MLCYSNRRLNRPSVWSYHSTSIDVVDVSRSYADETACTAPPYKGFQSVQPLEKVYEPKYWEIKPASLEEAVALGKRLEADGKTPQEVAAIMKLHYPNIKDDTNEEGGVISNKPQEPTGPLLPNGIALDTGAPSPLVTMTIEQIVAEVTKDSVAEEVRTEVKALLKDKT